MAWHDKAPLKVATRMEQTFLIQRLNKPYPKSANPKMVALDNVFAFGGGLINGGISDKAMEIIRDIFTFDYMGASEFEWGAVPKALSFLAQQSQKNNLDSGTVTLKDGAEVIYYICPKEYETEVRTRIVLLRNNDRSIDLKERCGLKEYFEPWRPREKDEVPRQVGWLELDNGFMFFVDKVMFDKTKQLFGL